jgi:hypothetical protein
VVLPILFRARLRRSHFRAAVNYAEPHLLAHPEDNSLGSWHEYLALPGGSKTR